MRASAVTGAVAATAALAVILSGCGSDTKTAASSSVSTPSAQPKTTAAEAASPRPTIADYIKENDIQEASVKVGEPGAPAVNLPIPDGWQALPPDKAPNYAYSAILYTGPQFQNDPPNIVALMSKLSGDVDQKKIIDLAPGELNNLPDYKPGNEGESSLLGDYPAYVLGGTYTRAGTTRVIAQKTVVIPEADGLYVLQLNVDGPEAASELLGAATDQIDSDATIG